MRRSVPVVLAALALCCAPAAMGLAEFGIEGMGVVSTPADEARATVAPDGRRIVWSSDREGGWRLWQATLRDGRWTDPQPLALDGPAEDSDPFFSADGRWLYFASRREGGHGGRDLHRAAVNVDGTFGAAENLGAAVNGAGDERAPTLSTDGSALLFSSDGHGGAGGHDLWVARWDGRAFVDPQPLPGINSEADETEAAWLQDGRGVVFARATDARSRLWVALCRQGRYADAQPLALSFNSAEGDTRGPVIDASAPGELLLSGSARAPRAGKLDIYRMKAPSAEGDDSCR